MRVSCVLVSILLVLVGAPACGGGESPRSAVDVQLRGLLDEHGISRPVSPAPDADTMVRLGRLLFFDKILSGNRNISCATCHHPTAGSGDGLPVSIGQGGEGLGTRRSLGTGVLVPRNAPPLFSGGFSEMRSMFWDSRIRFDEATGVFHTPEPGLNGTSPSMAGLVEPLDGALAAQAMFPVTSRDEMRGEPGENELANASDNEAVWARIMDRLVGSSDGSHPGILEYQVLFFAAYSEVASLEELTFGHAARAIAAYERSVFTATDTPFDRYLAGDAGAMTDEEKRGAVLFFGAAGCATCHGGPLLSDFDHHALCVPQLGPGKGIEGDDRGLALLTADPADAYRFRTPPLRGVALSGPWMHDGCFQNLEDAVRHHLDPLGSQLEYDATLLPLPFSETYDSDTRRQSARMDAVSPMLDTAVDLAEAELAALLAFLHTLTDPRHLDLGREVPDRVPSGLPVHD